MNTLPHPEVVALFNYWHTAEYDDRVTDLLNLDDDLTQSDAQGVADAEFLTNWRAKQ